LVFLFFKAKLALAYLAVVLYIDALTLENVGNRSKIIAKR
jgi:hypothetical protein